MSTKARVAALVVASVLTGGVYTVIVSIKWINEVIDAASVDLNEMYMDEEVIM